MNDRLIQDLKNSWRNCNAATVGFLTNIPNDKLTAKAFQGRFKSFSWEFSCLIRTRLCYLEGLRTGRLNFADHPEVPNKEALILLSKSELLEYLSQTTNAMIAEIEKIESEEKIKLVIWLLQHKRIHHGKLILYISQANIDLPSSFVKTWGESNFKKK